MLQSDYGLAKVKEKQIVTCRRNDVCFAMTEYGEDMGSALSENEYLLDGTQKGQSG